MSMLPELLGSEGTPLSIEFRGKKYGFKPITFGLMEQIEVARFEEAKKRLKGMAGLYSPEAMDKKADQIYTRYEAGEFGFLAKDTQAWLKTPAGATRLVKATLGIDDEILIPMVLEKGEEIKRLIDAIVKESFPGQSEDKPAGEGQAQEATFRPDR